MSTFALQRERCRRHVVFLLGACLGAAILAACSSARPIDTDVAYRYVAAARDMTGYRIEFQRMPEFLKPMLRDEVSRVLADKGLAYSEGEARSVLLMTFDSEPLPSAIAEDASESGERSIRVVAARFNARVSLELTDSVSRERIWAGRLSRVHYATEGAYMHEAAARRAIRAALRDIFADFPNRNTEANTRD